MKWLHQLYNKYFGKEEAKDLQYTFFGVNPEIIRTATFKNGTGEEWGREWILIWWDNYLFQRNLNYYRGPLERFLKHEQDLKNLIKFGPLTQQEEETMNENLNTPVAPIVDAEAVSTFIDADDIAFAALLAAKPDGIVGYTTDAPETDDEPTIH